MGSERFEVRTCPMCGRSIRARVVSYFGPGTANDPVIDVDIAGHEECVRECESSGDRMPMRMNRDR